MFKTAAELAVKNWQRQRLLLRSLEQFIQTVKGQKIFGKWMFLTCSCMFLISDKLEQLEFE